MSGRHSTAVRRFQPISRLKGYTVDDKVSDPRGWDAVDGAGRTIGEVKDLLVDTDRLASYLVVDVDLRALELDGDPRVLVPMNHAHRDGDRKRIVVPGLTRSRIAALLLERADAETEFWDRWWRGSDAAAEEVPTRAAEPVDASELHTFPIERPRRP
ncbi:MAG TPA: PRC-barrel domain-containing protein [Vicinamibacterales bacterium]|nr:PRC-barrel domain-containing protein [Vicinamibacterales bacterium]